MIYYKDFEFSRCEKIVLSRNVKNKPQKYYNNIFTFDIETTSYYLAPDGKLMIYDFAKNADFYEDCEKGAIMYLWQFGIDDNVIFGRTWEEFTDFFELFRAEYPEYKYIYIHNFSFEFQFLRNIFEFDKVFARRKRKPLFAVFEKNTEFRCSYFLTQLSLKNWAEQKRLPVRKLVGELNYNVLRTPLTPLSESELQYAENDILIMFYGLREYREKYKTIPKIPLTQTGEIRVELNKILKNEKNFSKRQKTLMPETLAEYKFLDGAFFGGDVHANYINANQLWHNVRGYDFSSSYPWVMISEKYPDSKFTPVNLEENRKKYYHNPEYSYIIVFEAEKIKSNKFNLFLSQSRCQFVDKKSLVKYNGRIISCDYICAEMTNLDFELFQDCYDFEDLKILDFRVSKNRFLNDVFCKYVLELFGNKTKLKGIESQYALYMVSKQYINSLYGMSVTRDFTDEIYFDGKDWGIIPTDSESFKKKFNSKQRQVYKFMMAMQVGIFVTAYARRNLWRGIVLPNDENIIYFDTDSGKYLGNPQEFVSAYNMHVLRNHAKIAERLNCDINDLSPEDKHGKKHYIGLLEDDGIYSDFKAIGAKKYAYKENDKIKITIAGVPKKNAEILGSVDELADGLEFPIETCGKNILHYCENQHKIIFPDGFISREKYGICLQPTGYKVGASVENIGQIMGNLNPWEELEIGSELFRAE